MTFYPVPRCKTARSRPAAGSKELYEEAQPLLDVMGKASYFLGEARRCISVTQWLRSPLTSLHNRARRLFVAAHAGRSRRKGKDRD